MNRDLFFAQLSRDLSSEDLKVVQKAYWLAKEAHRKQTRMNGERYFEHLRRVAISTVTYAGRADVRAIVLGLLHDVIEDTYVPAGVIGELFGEEIQRNCVTLSKEVPQWNALTGELICRTKLHIDDYLYRIRNASAVVKLVKGCDRLDNVQDLATFKSARKERYIEETKKLLPIIDTCYVPLAYAIKKKMNEAIDSQA
jgi:GTP pyrophosphokinase/guanosine-3',5'-bis(diphosphate) 3'-pyrophosphohydrolase